MVSAVVASCEDVPLGRKPVCRSGDGTSWQSRAPSAPSAARSTQSWCAVLVMVHPGSLEHLLAATSTQAGVPFW